ncbi:hypothetical protein PF006_g10661 [Phytophthora fragariae]|uniref:Uncharacterized protein n=1 Tax=Phytophthora fragariae TaxID=53985 RepID=A0A6A3U419_9STRA|nr:hypothetical protein PF006_g10661 [Phytophthora fragariae]
MQPDEQTWRYAIEDEEAASAAVVEAERVLHRQLQHHLAISPTVDGEVSELDLRRTEYAVAVRAIDEAAAVYHRAQGEAMLQQARAEQHHDATTRSSVVRRSHSSSSGNGSSPRPTKRLNLGLPSCGPAIQSSGSEEDTGRSGESEDSGSGNASDPRHFRSTRPCL